MGNLLRFVRPGAHERALMAQKSCAVGMRNTILRNYLHVIPSIALRIPTAHNFTRD